MNTLTEVGTPDGDPLISYLAGVDTLQRQITRLATTYNELLPEVQRIANALRSMSGPAKL